LVRYTASGWTAVSKPGPMAAKFKLPAAADGAAVVHTRFAARIRRQMRLKPRELPLA